MWQGIIEYAQESGAGLFAILFVALLATTIGFVSWVLKSSKESEAKHLERELRLEKVNDEREKRYIKTIDTLAASFAKVDVKVDGVRSCVDEARKDIGETKQLVVQLLGKLSSKD